MRILALDIGNKRTGIAWADVDAGTIVALDTLSHDDDAQLIEHVVRRAREKSADTIVVGWPLLLSGEEGFQARAVQTVIDALQQKGLHVERIDERFSSTAAGRREDPDAKAACSIAEMYLDRIK